MGRDTDKLKIVNTELAKWCYANNGTLKSEVLRFQYCVGADGKAIALLNVGISDRLFIQVYDAETAARMQSNVMKSDSERLAYLKSNGISGVLTLLSGERIELLRIGNRSQPKDYQLNTPYPNLENLKLRYLREVASVRRISSPEVKPGRWEIQFSDGEKTVGAYSLVNTYLANKGDSSYNTDEGLAGVQSAHLLMVIKRAGSDAPIEARISIFEIASISFNKLVTSPTTVIPVKTSDADFESKLKNKWINESRARLEKPVDDSMPIPPTICRGSGINLDTIELRAICAQYLGEWRIANSSGRYTYLQTPLHLLMESHDSMSVRSIY